MGDAEQKPLWRDLAETAGTVLLIGVFLFAVSGVWPPMVAVESGSMEPNMSKGDLVFVTAPDRYTASASTDSGVVTRDASQGYERFGMRGDVVIYAPPDRRGSPIIHRAMFHVEDGENWYDEAEQSALPPGVDSCEALAHCPASNAGFITKGDANPTYDQAVRRAPPVKDAWIQSKATFGAPYLGCVRLALTGRGC